MIESYKDPEMLAFRELLSAKVETAFEDWKRISQGKAPTDCRYKRKERLAYERELLIEYFVSDREASLSDDLKFLFDNWEEVYCTMMDRVWSYL